MLRYRWNSYKIATLRAPGTHFWNSYLSIINILRIRCQEGISHTNFVSIRTLTPILLAWLYNFVVSLGWLIKLRTFLFQKEWLTTETNRWYAMNVVSYYVETNDMLKSVAKPSLKHVIKDDINTVLQWSYLKKSHMFCKSNFKLGSGNSN